MFTPKPKQCTIISNVLRHVVQTLNRSCSSSSPLNSSDTKSTTDIEVSIIRKLNFFNWIKLKINVPKRDFVVIYDT